MCEWIDAMFFQSILFVIVAQQQDKKILKNIKIRIILNLNIFWYEISKVWETLTPLGDASKEGEVYSLRKMKKKNNKQQLPVNKLF